MEILENRAQWAETFRNGWLAEFERSGAFNWKIYNRPTNSTAPSGTAVDLPNSRLMVVTTAGAYLNGTQSPFDAPNPLGDYSIRAFASDVSFGALAYAHDHYDHTAVIQDPQVLLPLAHLAELVAAGEIGALHPQVISFMGYQPDVRRTLDELIPAVLHHLADDPPDAVLLVPS